MGETHIHITDEPIAVKRVNTCMAVYFHPSEAFEDKNSRNDKYIPIYYSSELNMARGL